MDMKEIFQMEQEHLKEVIEKINKKIADAEAKFNEQEHFIIGFKEGQRGTQFNRQAMMSMYATEITNLKSIVDNPYFGRFEFKSNGGETALIYIGKKAAVDEDNVILTHDWRSPVCSMYYDYSIGDATYKVNDKVISGQILSKRQINIKDGILKSVDDQDTLSTDQMLVRYLSENSDSRLKSIIATIQREQNAIIRKPLRKNYIVQGVAGSGKTTVALHRIAYLLYNEAKVTDSSEFMILGPNKYFLNYISLLLPDLDIKNVSESTFESLVLEYLKLKVKVESKNDTLRKVMEGQADESIVTYKSSLEFMQLLEKFINAYFVYHLQEDIKYEGLVLCTKEKLKRLYEGNIFNHSYQERINTFLKALTKEIKEKAPDLAHEVWLRYRDEFRSLPKGHPRREEITRITTEIETSLKKGCPSVLKDYFKFAKVNLLSLYRMFIENIEAFSNSIPVDAELLKDSTLNGILKKQVDSEDLTALALMNYVINGSKDYDRFTHLVIDEAQDFSMADYYVLRKMFPKANFDIFGDINQSIYAYRGITDWEILRLGIFDEQAEILNLNKSYRTTRQIAETANLVLRDLNQEETECIARSGRDVSVTSTENDKKLQGIVGQINELLDKGYQNIAVICKDDIEAKKVYKDLKKLGLDVNYVIEQNESYVGGVTIIPSYLSKGLEFDAVILNDASNLKYDESEINMRLLYVAITRAMHELYINYQKELAKSLGSLVKTSDTEKQLLKKN